MALIRYPGSKAKLASEIVSRMPHELRRMFSTHPYEYREPFWGCGAVGFHALKNMPNTSTVWLNDKDYYVACLWNAVLSAPRELKQLIKEFKPTAEAFYRFKDGDGVTGVDPVVAGFQKLACHQMSVSGFGVMSGGPLGGKDQVNANYPVDCRWNASRLRRSVDACHRQLQRFGGRIRITCRDFSELLTDVPRHCFVYCDPPYVKAGPQLYKHSMDDADHGRLAGLLRSLKCEWVLSYDDHPLVRQLYGDCSIESVDITYTNATNATGKRPKNSEVVIQPQQVSAGVAQ